ncbi:MAG TPA: hypothetical protein VHB51_02910 [Candidatus Saccharimonadales bacterium]|nr:hypothetical protein [Candidatus Saccharimonadales bacterium]
MALELVGQPKPPLEPTAPAELTEKDFVDESLEEAAANAAIVAVNLSGLRYRPLAVVRDNPDERQAAIDLTDKLEVLSELRPDAAKELQRLCDCIVYAWNHTRETGVALARTFLSDQLDVRPIPGQQEFTYEFSPDTLFLPYPRDPDIVEQKQAHTTAL